MSLIRTCAPTFDVFRNDIDEFAGRGHRDSIPAINTAAGNAARKRPQGGVSMVTVVVVLPGHGRKPVRGKFAKVWVVVVLAQWIAALYASDASDPV